MIYRGDKVVLVKELPKLKEVGLTYEVGDLTGKSVIIRDVASKVAICAIDFETFDEYFAKPEEVRTWTQWEGVISEIGVVYYRTNLKKVQVKIPTELGEVRAECSLTKGDEFNLHFGIQLAYKRAISKYLVKKEKALSSELAKVISEFKDNKNKINTMINQLYKED
jgi:hypothetical protein